MSTVAPISPVDGGWRPIGVCSSRGDTRHKSSSIRASDTVPTVAVQVLGVEFGNVGYVLAWAGFCVLHAICAAYLVVAGRVYAVLPTLEANNFFQLYQLTLNSSHFQTIAHVHYALASVHMYFLLRPAVLAVANVCVPATARERLTTSLEAIVRRSSSINLSRSLTSKPAITINSVRLKTTQIAKRAYHLLLARDGLFGVHSDHFELFFLGREVVETVLQTYQGYMMSRLLPRERLNSFYTLILVINCWTTPLLRRVCGGNRTLERLLVVLCDVVLDFVSSIGVPVAVAIGYIKQYDPVLTDFSPATLYYDDVWLINYMNEAPIVFFGSWLDAVSRLVFSLGLLSSLDDIKALVIKRPKPKLITHTTPVTPLTGNTNDSHKSCLVISREKTQPVAAIYTRPIKTLTNRTAIVRWIHIMMMLWGAGVGVVYLEANVRTPATHCSLPLRPWLVSAPACAVVTINCQKHPLLTGAASDFETIFSALDAASVEYVIFRHCPYVEMVPRLRTLHNLYGLKTFDSTIKRWNLDAALTSTAHPRVRFLFFERAHFPDGMLPPGLSHAEFPSTLLDFEIAVSNLQVLPETLPWPPSMIIGIEFSQLMEFPAVLFLSSLWLLALLCLRGNPLQELPHTSHAVLALPRSNTGWGLGFQLFIEYTRVRSLPAWVSGTEIYAAQSPLCTQVMMNESSAERAELLDDHPWLATVAANCEIDPGPVGFYPLQVDMQEGE